MIVPSRSRKTAGCLACIVPEGVDQFLSRNGGCTEFGNNYPAGMICDLSRFDWRSSASQREREERDCRITGARYVENLARFCGNMMRLAIFLKQHHAVLAECNKQAFEVPLFQERFADLCQIDIFFRNCGG